MSRILSQIIKNYKTQPLYIQVRYSRDKPFVPVIKKTVVPELYYSLKERLAEKDEKLKDPEKYARVNIGYSLPKTQSNSLEKVKHIQELKKNVKLEKQARALKLKIDLDTVESEWIALSKPNHIKALADNSEIYKHLFGDYAYFYPVVNMNICYDYDEETVSPVYFGNLLKPKESASTPIVEFESDSDSLWTLILTSPDGNLLESESEMIHWFVGNIPGGNVAKGEEIMDYMRPIPPKGSGFHRYCFVLYKQDGKLDFSEFLKEKPCLRLSDRSFKTYDFYKNRQDVLTPVGLSWFQADYDLTLTDFFHHTLKMKEPIFEYEFPKPYIAPQLPFPQLRPFNRYLDLHRDPKEMQQLMLIKRLKRVHPFQGEKPLLPFPQAEPIPKDWPHWQVKEIQKERGGEGKYRDMYRGDDRPYIHEGKITHLINDLKK